MTTELTDRPASGWQSDVTSWAIRMIFDWDLGSAGVEAEPAGERPGKPVAGAVRVSVDSVGELSIVVATLLNVGV